MMVRIPYYHEVYCYLMRFQVSSVNVGKLKVGALVAQALVQGEVVSPAST